MKREGFINKQVAEITGLEPQTIAYYTNRGFVVPSVDPGKGRGSNRRYSEKDMVKLLLIRELVDHGVSLEKVGIIFDQLAWHLSRSSEILNPKRARSNRVVIGIYDYHTKDPVAAIVAMPDPEKLGGAERGEEYRENLRNFKVDILNHSSIIIIDITHLLEKVAGA